VITVKDTELVFRIGDQYPEDDQMENLAQVRDLQYHDLPPSDDLGGIYWKAALIRVTLKGMG